jgi:ornithine cyclodeaminase/alanine dehydrogenase-like protein (mu-crystallin family)
LGFGIRRLSTGRNSIDPQRFGGLIDSADQITLYNSVGVAIQDLAIARLLIERAREWGRGRELG